MQTRTTPLIKLGPDAHAPSPAEQQGLCDLADIFWLVVAIGVTALWCWGLYAAACWLAGLLASLMGPAVPPTF